MSHRHIKSSPSAVIQKIEYLLEEYPDYPYQSAFSIPELRQKLIVHILSIVPSRRSMEEEQQPFTRNSKLRHTSLVQERLRLETVIHGSILHILRENAHWLSYHLPKI